MKLKNLPRKILRKLLYYVSRFLALVRTWWIRRVTRKPIWYTDRYGITCRLYPDDSLPFYFTGRSLYDDGGVLFVLRKELKPGMTVFDVGAGFGAFSLYAAARVTPGGCVHAFEPASYTFGRLQENLAHSPDLEKVITPVRAAVFNAPGEVTLNMFDMDFPAWNWSTLGMPTIVYRGQSYTPTKSETVPSITLDAYCAERGIQQIDLLKIDVEGFEAEVIQGARELVRQGRVRRVIFEISLAPLAGAGHTAQDILGAFVDCGLHVSRITPNGQLIPVEDVATFQPPFFANYFAAPE